MLLINQQEMLRKEAARNATRDAIKKGGEKALPPARDVKALPAARDRKALPAARIRRRFHQQEILLVLEQEEIQKKKRE